MCSAGMIVPRLFRMPGDPQTRTADLLAEAAAGYELLLNRIVRGPPGNCPPAIRSLALLLDDPALWHVRSRLLADPILIEALHACRGALPQAGARDFPGASHSRRTFDADCAPRDGPGHLVLPLLLRSDAAWCGTLESSTDAFGRLQFPLCDWTIALRRHTGQPAEVVAGEGVLIQADAAAVRFRLAASDHPFLRLTRDGARRMFVENDPELSPADVRFGNGGVCPRVQFAPALRPRGVRFDPVCFENPREHTGWTGAIVAGVVAALREVSPLIGEEFGSCMHSIRGFELPRVSAGVVQSFSTPSLPRVMGINIPYTVDGDPQLDPFCFTWFGHELAHTKHYLIDAVAYGNGWTFLTNPEDLSPPLPRYGRSLPVRTLFQLPYTHLYEWTLLMDFMEADWQGLPWDVNADATAAGEEMRSEIEEGFGLIAGCARLTAWGRSAVRHFLRLYRDAGSRWRRACCAPGMSPGAYVCSSAPAIRSVTSCGVPTPSTRRSSPRSS